MSTQKPEASLTAIGKYFSAVEENIKNHGENTVVFMLIGDFYEIYVKYNKETDTYYGSNLWEIRDILQCQRITETKKTKLGNGDVLKMWGVPQSAIEDKKTALIKNNFNIVLYDQRKDEKGKVIERYLSEVVTPGTYIPKDDSLIELTSNNITSIIFKEFTVGGLKRIGYGYANFDVLTGHTRVFDGVTENNIVDHTTLNDIEHYLISNNPKELLIITNMNDDAYEKIKKAVGLVDFHIKKFNMNDEKTKNCFKPEYIKKTIETVYKNSEYFSEFEFCELATSSLCFLIDYVNIYSPLALIKITDPEVIDNDRMILANHTHQQLNIIPDISNNKGKLSCVLSSLNNCITTIGKRNFKYQLLNPTKNIDKLNKDYNIIEHILNNSDLIYNIRNSLKNIYDTEYLLRKITNNKYFCIDLFKMYKSMHALKSIRDLYLNNDNYFSNYINSFIEEDILNSKLDIFLNDVESKLKINDCDVTDIRIDDINIIKPNYCKEFDEIREKYNRNIRLVQSIINEVNHFLKTELKDNSNSEYIQVNEYEKTSSDLKITIIRTDRVKDLIKKLNCNRNLNESTIINVGIAPNIYKIDLNDFNFKKKDKTNHIIQHKLINDTLEEIFYFKHSLTKSANKIFGEIMNELLISHSETIERLSNLIGIIDATICKAYNSKKMNYCKPEIQDNEKSFVNVNGLRHQLIEQILTNENYVTNDIELGKEKNGLLLFGTNAVGKTSFIRALGISIIMAQSGMYVPATEFVYKPYSEIFSRILGNDNLFKGLSTFQVEISELRTILKYAGKNSLILGDELCSGTEHDSALCINACGLIHLNKVNSTYIFATHLHELVEIEEINALKNLYIKHMSVEYDNKTGQLIYERKFKDGNGSSRYGLEVIKSVLSNEFVEKCFDMRKNLCGQDVLFLDSKKSRYNSNFLKEQMCELCKVNKAYDVHHIQEQCLAVDGYIGSIKKNSPSNMVSLCKKCHNMQTEGSDIKIIERVKTTNGYKLRLNNNQFI